MCTATVYILPSSFSNEMKILYIQAVYPSSLTHPEVEIWQVGPNPSPSQRHDVCVHQGLGVNLNQGLVPNSNYYFFFFGFTQPQIRMKP